ncbi:hypothetical protein CEXT_26261 [Caerostris extrusa]|uniref:Uncharacterized protein n=1 Tax=Caerostris extrusa TaxID=172846 RepID=A0AAV4W9Y6_CAEEX|nr:hypothetical protein CEXT_26261 [Caerostris extrusa]
MEITPERKRYPFPFYVIPYTLPPTQVPYPSCIFLRALKALKRGADIILPKTQVAAIKIFSCRNYNSKVGRGGSNIKGSPTFEFPCFLWRIKCVAFEQ